MTAVQTMWSTLGERVQAVHKNIDDGKSTLAEEDFTTAKRSWNRLAEFAEKMQDIGSGVSTEVLPEPRVRHLFAVAAGGRRQNANASATMASSCRRLFSPGKKSAVDSSRRSSRKSLALWWAWKTQLAV
jgi:hypothetical protein